MSGKSSWIFTKLLGATQTPIGTRSFVTGSSLKEYICTHRCFVCERPLCVRTEAADIENGLPSTH